MATTTYNNPVPRVYLFGQDAITGNAWSDVRQIDSSCFDNQLMLYRVRFGPYTLPKNIYKSEILIDSGKFLLDTKQFHMPEGNVYEISISQHILGSKAFSKPIGAPTRMYDMHHVAPVEKKKTKIYYSGAYNSFIKDLDNDTAI